jgi:hypothetical protein
MLQKQTPDSATVPLTPFEAEPRPPAPAINDGHGCSQPRFGPVPYAGTNFDPHPTTVSGTGVVGDANSLKLSLIDVLNLGETDLFHKDGNRQMMVIGSDDDTVDLLNTHRAGVADGLWAQHGTTRVGGVTYAVFEHSGAQAELLVQQGVRIAVHS